MEIRVVTPDGQKGTLLSSPLNATAWKPVTVRMPEGQCVRCFLRDLKLDPDAAPLPAKTQPR